MPGAKAIEAFEQRRIVDGSAAVDGGHVDVVFRDDDSLPFKPCKIALSAERTGHDPEGVARLANVWFEEERAEVLETGEAFDKLRLKTIPDENHEGGVGKDEVCVEERFAIAEIAFEVLEGGSCRDYEESTVMHDVNGRFGGAVEEVDTEDAVGDGWGFLSHA
jgi:hypothetical protein